jgi:predicted DNA-binding transcriptional regulator AlpA
MQNIIVTSSDELKSIVGEAIRSALAEALPKQSEPRAQTEEKYIGERELRALLGLSHPTVLRLRKQGLLPYFRLGKRIMYSPNEVREAMAKQALRGGRK